MTFLEDWLGISPDGGSGLLEVLLLIIICGVLVAVARIAQRVGLRNRRR
jgi:hypothetical protein